MSSYFVFIVSSFKYNMCKVSTMFFSKVVNLFSLAVSWGCGDYKSNAIPSSRM